jgi:hypothetical protein
MDPQMFALLAMMLGPAGAAWVGVKVSLNGTRDRVKNIDAKLDRLVADNVGEHSEFRERLTRAETRIGAG